MTTSMTSVDETRCLACSASSHHFKLYGHHDVEVTRESLPALERKFHDFAGYIFKGGVRICNNCGYGVMLTPPSPSQLRTYYTKQFWNGYSQRVANANQGKVSDKHKLRALWQVKTLEQVINISNLCSTLEIGAGDAHISQVLKQQVPSLFAAVCESGEQWQNYYKEKKLIHVADYFPFKSDNEYDLIIASHWLEHIIDVPGVLDEIYRMLKPGGALLIDVPNTAGTYWDYPHADIPHIHFFTKPSLKQILANAGFECSLVENYGITAKQSSEGRSIENDDFKKNDAGYSTRAIFLKPGL